MLAGRKVVVYFENYSVSDLVHMRIVREICAICYSQELILFIAVDLYVSLTDKASNYLVMRLCLICQ